MSKITKDEVLRVAQLAHLELSDAEVDAFARQLDGILSYVEKLNELDTDHVEPMAQVVPPGAKSELDERTRKDDQRGGKTAEGTPLRDDVEVPCNVAVEVFPGAPDPDPPYFRVPKVIER